MSANYFSYQIVLYNSISRVIDQSIIEYHENILKILYPQETTWNRIGAGSQTAINSYDFVHYPEKLKDVLLTSLKNVENISCVLIDFSHDLNLMIRDPILIEIFNAIVVLYDKGFRHFVIVLPALPCIQSASIEVLRQYLINAVSKSEITLLDIKGQKWCNKEQTDEIIQENEFYKLAQKQYESPQKRLLRKCVQRLGHFQNNNGNPPRSCRFFSYMFVDNCEKEFYELFKNWWEHNGNNLKGIIFDCKNNSFLREAVSTVASQNDNILCESIEDVKKSQELLNKYKSLGTSVLVVDYFQSTDFLSKYLAFLEVNNIPVSNEIVCGVNKSGNIRTQWMQKFITGLISRPPHSNYDECIQCSLGLPHSSEIKETTHKIRTFDMLYMMSEVKWKMADEDEKEVPSKRVRHRNLPDFSLILNKYGDFIAYKFLFLLSKINHTIDLLVLHPDEGDSSQIVNLLHGQNDRKFTIQAIPRENAINKHIDGESWGNILSAQKVNQASWALELNSVRASGVIILDIFFSGGNTSRALCELAEYLNIPIFGVLVFMDLNPDIEFPLPTIKKYSLFDWIIP